MNGVCVAAIEFACIWHPTRRRVSETQTYSAVSVCATCLVIKSAKYADYECVYEQHVQTWRHSNTTAGHSGYTENEKTFGRWREGAETCGTKAKSITREAWTT